MPFAFADTFSCSSTGVATGNMFSIYDTQSNSIQNGTAGTNGTANVIVINPTTTGFTGGTGAAGYNNGDPYATGGACTSAMGIFGRVVCYFKNTVGNVVSQTCTAPSSCSCRAPSRCYLTLFIAVMGIFIMTGIAQFSVREIMINVLKIALVYGFATNAAWGIGIGYALFMGLAEQGSTLVLSSGNMPAGGSTLTSPDMVIGGLLNLTTLGNTSSSIFPSTLQTSPQCAFNLILLFVLLIIFAPYLAVFIGNVIMQYLWIYIRALLGYLTALVLIGFLFVLSPLFHLFRAVSDHAALVRAMA